MINERRRNCVNHLRACVIMATATVHQHPVNDKLRREVKKIARLAFDLAGNSAAMRVSGAKNLFGAPPRSTAIRTDQKLRS
jgi:hypothetical protein